MPESAVDACQRFSRSLRFVAKRYILQRKYPKKWIGSAFLGRRWHSFQPPTPTLSATMHSVTDRRADGPQ